MRSRSGALALSLVLLVWGDLSMSAQTCEILHSFRAVGGRPLATPVLASDGSLYGATMSGGKYGAGSVYRLSTNGAGGWSVTTQHSFDGQNGSGPFASLIQASDGKLYGTTASGGWAGRGTVFRIDLSGNFTSIASFEMETVHSPRAPLVEGPDGFVYGTASSGGASSQGGLFRFDLASTSLSFIHDFTRDEGDPDRVGLLRGDDGFLYGMTAGGDHDWGLVYRIDASGTLTPLHSLTETQGVLPAASLVRGGNGALYGAAFSGGDAGHGTIFRFELDGTFVRLHSFSGPDGSRPLGLTVGADGKLYGVTGLGGEHEGGTAFRISLGGAFELLRSLDPEDVGGRGPASGVAEGADGGFFGVTEVGGVAELGTAYRLDASGAFQTVHDFHSLEGGAPVAGLVAGADGLLWGTTAGGGAFGGGTVFGFDPAALALVVQHSLPEAAGGLSLDPLVAAADGLLYGATLLGGANDFGTFFRVDSEGVFEILYEFTEEDGRGPWSFIQANDGNFYGSNVLWLVRIDAGGQLTRLRPMPSPLFSRNSLLQASDGLLYVSEEGGGPLRRGAISRMELDGSDYTTLHAFSEIDGHLPQRLLQGADGDFYGTASSSVFRMDPIGHVELLYSFGGSGDAIAPRGALIQTDDGALHGASIAGGVAYGGGTVFRVGSDGTEKVLHSFRAVDGDGSNANGPLVEGSDGFLYGTTRGGGLYRGGLLFRVDPARQLAVLSVTPASGPAISGVQVEITGDGFAPGAMAWIGREPLRDPVVVSPAKVEAQTTFLRPGALHMVAVKNADGTEGSLAEAFFADFDDVPQGALFHDPIEKLVRNGILSSGCGSDNFCPTRDVTRNFLAVLLLRSRLGQGYVPTFAAGGVFGDVDIHDYAASWIEDLAARGITAGCGGGDFCPSGSVTRAQAAVFLLKTLLGPAYVPPEATGAVFQDVPANGFAAAWIEELERRGITGGCSASPKLYCPSDPVRRGQMAALLVNTFGLP